MALAAGVLAWASALAVGIGALWRHQETPGAAASPPMALGADWRGAMHLRPASGRATLIVLAHPHCPCTRATLHELAKVLARRPGRADTYVLFAKPPGCAPGWEKTGNWTEAEAIPGVTPLCDEGGTAARCLGASTSGQALLFGADGRLLFAGGITGSRGHEGDNDGADMLVALLDQARPPAQLLAAGPGPLRAPVFGCALHDSCAARETTTDHDGTDGNNRTQSPR